MEKNSILFDYIEKILVQEDLNNCFLQPERIGLRPKAVPNKLMMTPNGSMLLSPSMYKTPIRMPMNSGGTGAVGNCGDVVHQQALMRFMKEQQYYMVHKQEWDDVTQYNLNAYRKSDWYHMLLTVLDSNNRANKLTFIIFYSRNPDYLRSVSIAEWCNGYLELYPCFRHNINLHSVL